MAVAAVFLASKVEENMRQPRDIINAFHYFKCKRLGVAFEPLDLFSSVRAPVRLILIG